MAGCLAVEREGRVPAPKDHHRKMLSVEPDLAAAIRELCFELKMDSEAEVYRLLLRKGLEAIRTEREAERPKGRDE